ncbi:MAG: hypothetical protein DIU67_011025 [Actinomycetes bacterium]
MGDPACWMHELCPQCGSIAPERGPDDPCPVCGAAAEGEGEPG